MSFKKEVIKFTDFLKKVCKKAGIILKKIFTSKKFKDSAEYVGKNIIKLDKNSRKELEKIVTQNIIDAENTKLKLLQKTSWVIKKTLKEIGNNVLLKLKNIEIQDIMYLVGILVPQLFGKR